MSWQAILDGEIAERARRAVHQIAADLPAAAAHPPDHVLFHSYAESLLGADFADAHDAALGRLVAHVEAGAARIELYGGAAGAGWVAAHCADDVDDYLSFVDEALLGVIADWDGVYDLIGGLVGFAVYFLERGDAPAARTGLQLIVERLAARAERSSDGIAWHTPQRHIPSTQHHSVREGYYNCGLAHGMPGIVAVLGKIAERPEPPPAVSELLDGGLRWLWSRDQGAGSPWRFPTWIHESTALASRTAWCYGDPGVAVALWNAAARTGRSTEDARAIALEALRRTSDHAAIQDPMLCHGAGGLGHLANRCYQASGDPAFLVEARRWFTRALDYHGDRGVGGFVTRVAASGPDQFAPSPEFLDGSLGLGLALVAALEPLEPDWDRLLLCDLPVLA